MLINPQSWRWTFRTTSELRTVPLCWLAASLVVDGWGDGCMVASRSSRASKHAYADGRGPGVGAKVAGFGGGKPPSHESSGVHDPYQWLQRKERRQATCHPTVCTP